MRGNHKIVVARVNYQITHRNRRQIASLYIVPNYAHRRRNPKTEFRTDKHQILFTKSSLQRERNRVPANFRRQSRPGFPKSDVL
jgi:hypothetical protein